MTRIIKIPRRQLSQEELLRACKKKDRKAQKLFFERFAPLLFTTCRRYGTNYYPAKDLMQDAFIRVFQHLDRFDGNKGKLESWMARIAINLALNALRKQKIDWVEFKDEQMDLRPDIRSRAKTDLSEEEILSIIADLPIGYKTVFNLFIIDGFSHQDIAKELGISVSTSKSQLFKAKKTLQQQIR
ncbi:MAG: sigma-70 family RNA polymerase sigma factor, partial [Bacteroidota bacterium]